MNKDELMALGIDEELCDRIVLEQGKMKEEYENRIDKMKKECELEIMLYESGAKNIKAVRALISEDESAAEQIEKLKKGADTSFLFESKRKSFEPKRSGERLPDTTVGDFEARLSEARRKGNTVEAIRIKQQAASEGIMLV